MISEIKYELPIYSTTLEKDPVVESKDMDIEIELIGVDEEWLEELKGINEETYNYWKPKHYIMYLDEVGMFQFIAQGFEVIENE